MIRKSAGHTIILISLLQVQLLQILFVQSLGRYNRIEDQDWQAHRHTKDNNSPIISGMFVGMLILFSDRPYRDKVTQKSLMNLLSLPTVESLLKTIAVQPVLNKCKYKKYCEKVKCINNNFLYFYLVVKYYVTTKQLIHCVLRHYVV